MYCGPPVLPTIKKPSLARLFISHSDKTYSAAG
jgi:hypothetical protein